MPRHAPCSKGTPSGRRTACHAGTVTYCAAVPKARYDCAPKPHTRSPTRDGSTPTPTESISPAPSLCGTTRGYGMAEPSHPCRFLMSPGFTPDARTRMRTSPARGSGSGISPTSRTSSAPPCFSYHAALMYQLRKRWPTSATFWRASKRKDGLHPQRVAFGLVAHATFLLPLRSDEPAFAAVVLDTGAERHGAPPISIGPDRCAGLFVVGDLPVQVAARARDPTMAQTPAQAIVDVHLVAGLVVGVLVLEVVVVQRHEVTVEAGRIDVAHRPDRPDGQVVAADVGEVVLVVATGRRGEVKDRHGV